MRKAPDNELNKSLRGLVRALKVLCIALMFLIGVLVWNLITLITSGG